MAISWGTAITSGIHAYRLGHEITQSPTKVSGSTASVTVTARLYLQTRWAVNDSNKTFSWSGSFGSGSTSFSFSTTNKSGTGWSSDNIRLVKTLTRTFAPSYSTTTVSRVSASMTGVYAVPGTARTSGSWTTGARPVSAPAPVTNVAAARVSDTKHTISWTRQNASDPAKPYTKILVERWDNVAGDYQTVATLGNVSSWTDTGTRPGRRYRWRVGVFNAAGGSGWEHSPFVYTTLPAPTGVTAARVGGDIEVSWTAAGGGSLYQPTARVAPLTTAGEVDYDSIVDLAYGVTSWTAQAPDPTRTWAYAVQWKGTNDGTGNVWSAWTKTDTVQLLTPPKAPTRLAPASADAALPVRLTWRHNSVDSSAQTKYQVAWRQPGGSWANGAQAASATQAWTMPAGTLAAGTWEVRVRTWGAHADPSPWSSVHLLTLSEKPSVTIRAPEDGGTFAGSRVIARWTFYDPDGGAQAAWRVTLYAEDGARLWQMSGANDGNYRTINYMLQDGLRYTIGVMVQDSHGLWSEEATTSFLVDFAPPPAPVAEAAWQPDTGSVVLTYSTPDPAAGEVEAVSVTVERSTDGGEWVTLFEGLPTAGAVVDPAPALGVASSYRVQAVSALPSTAEGAPLMVLADGDGWTYLNGGPGLTTMVRVKGGTKIDASFDRGLDFVEVAADDGRPLAVTNAQTSQEFKVAARLAPNVGAGATYRDLREFIRAVDPPVLYRDPTGERLWVAVHGLQHTAQRNIRTASFSVTEIQADGMEG